MTIFNLPRDQRTPETEIDIILTNLSVLFSEMHPDKEKSYFIDEVFSEFYKNEHTCGDRLVALVNENIPASGVGIGKAPEIGMLYMSLAYCCQAQRAWDEGNFGDAWTYVVDSREWCSILMARHPGITRLLTEEHKAKVSSVRRESRRIRTDKYDYSDFVEKAYRSRAWADKTKASNVIGEELYAHILKNELPIRWLPAANESGQSAEEQQSDYFKYVWGKLPSAAQVKADAKCWSPPD